MNDLKNKVQKLLSLADIEIDGDRPWDIQVHNEAFYGSVFNRGSLGLGEAYVDGWWDSQSLDEFFHKILLARLGQKIKNPRFVFHVLRAKLLNLQKKSRAFHVGREHYDIGNDLYKAMLDRRLTYSCGYWKDATNLNDAQEAKLDLVCQKIDLKKGHRVLDIGCGWGSFAKYAAEKHGAEVVGITVSKKQRELGMELTKKLPVEIRLQDYRDVSGQFDRIVSLGMFEHIGCKNYRLFMKIVHRLLKDGGLFLLHTIGANRSRSAGDPWVEKYIFPNGMLPSIKQVGESTEGLFVMEDWHNFGADYDKTLIAWFENLDRTWEKLRLTYTEQFCRMWKYYLLLSAGTFRVRKNQLWQIVLSKKGVSRGYTSIR